MEPNITLNVPAIGVAAIVAFFVGYLWYGPIFGKLWAREMGFPEDFQLSGARMARAILLQILGMFLITYVLAHSQIVWRPSTWNAGADQADWTYGAYSAFFTWIGFILPVLFAGIAWEGRSLRLFLLNAAYYLVNLTIIAMIIAHWS